MALPNALAITREQAAATKPPLDTAASISETCFRVIVLQQHSKSTTAFVVPFRPGGTTDIVGQILVEQLSGELEKPVVIENRGGASMSFGAQMVAGASKDGYTLLLASATTSTTNPHLLASIKYRLEDFAPGAMVVRVPFAFVVKKDFPAADIKAFEPRRKPIRARDTHATVKVDPPAVVGLSTRTYGSKAHIKYTESGYRERTNRRAVQKPLRRCNTSSFQASK